MCCGPRASPSQQGSLRGQAGVKQGVLPLPHRQVKGSWQLQHLLLDVFQKQEDRSHCHVQAGTHTSISPPSPSKDGVGVAIRNRGHSHPTP